jgi:hypothetical protein
MKIIYNKILPFLGFVAINLFGIVFARIEHKPLTKKTINHEEIHTAQMREMLYVFFYLFYGLEWIIKLFIYGKDSYRNISFEREAYEHDQEYDYLSKINLFAWVKFIW